MRELVGQGKPFYSALDKAAGLLRRKVGTGSEFLKELMSIPGVKQAEIAERGLGELLNAPKMTHEQFMAALGSKPVPAIQEKMLGEQVKDNKLRNQAWEQAYEYSINNLLDIGLSLDQARQKALELADERINRYLPKGIEEHRTYHGEYTLPGGENYREMLIKAPAPAYSQDKIMEVEAKLRRAAPNMVKHYTDMLNVMKKDAGQNEQFPGVPQHFGGEPGILASLRLKDRTGPNGEKLLHLEELQSDWHQQGREKGYKKSFSKEDNLRYKDLYDKHFGKGETYLNPEELKEFESLDKKRDLDLYGVPNAPFKKNWEEMALKRLIHHAAEKGYHGVVVTPGAEQADRYNLAKHIDSIMLVPNPQSNKETHPYYFKAFDKRGNRVANDAVDEAGLQEYIGKEPAKQLLSSPANPLGERMISGANIVTGGEGMKGFYDKKVPNILNGIGKKYGVKTELNGHSEKLDNGSLRHNSQGVQIEFPPEYRNLHYFPITEEMRQDVKKNGIPLYKSGGTVPTH